MLLRRKTVRPILLGGLGTLLSVVDANAIDWRWMPSGGSVDVARHLTLLTILGLFAGSAVGALLYVWDWSRAYSSARFLVVAAGLVLLLFLGVVLWQFSASDDSVVGVALIIASLLGGFVLGARLASRNLTGSRAAPPNPHAPPNPYLSPLPPRQSSAAYYVVAACLTLAGVGAAWQLSHRTDAPILMVDIAWLVLAVLIVLGMAALVIAVYADKPRTSILEPYGGQGPRPRQLYSQNQFFYVITPCLTVLGLGAIWAKQLGFAEAAIVVLAGSIAFGAASRAIMLLGDGDSIEIQSDWGGLGSGMGGWKLSPAAGLVLITLVLAGAAIGVAIKKDGGAGRSNQTTETPSDPKEKDKDKQKEQEKRVKDESGNKAVKSEK